MSNISYSAWKKYLTCPKMYDYHYNKGLRPSGTSSALAFGVAMDEALNALLLETDDPFDKFKEFFDFDKLQDTEWDKRDLDVRVFSEEQLKKLNGTDLDYQCWATLRVKGRKMIESYQDIFLPRVKKVIAVQKEIDGRPGVLDAVLEIEGEGVVLVDHKTSARPYRQDAVRSSTQLALYAAAEGYKRAGFVVLIKSNVSKNLQIIIDDVPEMNKELIQESIGEVENAIKSGHFHRNLEACGKIYGKPCPYQKKCWNNQENGLYYKKTKERK